MSHFSRDSIIITVYMKEKHFLAQHETRSTAIRWQCQGFLSRTRRYRVGYFCTEAVSWDGYLVMRLLQRPIISCVPQHHRAFRPFITRHPLQRQAHHRLIKPGCVSCDKLDVLGARVASFIFCHSQWMLLSSVSARYFIALLWACSLTPISQSSLDVELAT